VSCAAWQRLLVLLAASLTVACPPRLLPGVPHVPSFADCPGMLRPSDEIDGAFLLRQDIRLRSEHLDVGVQLIVQKKGARLVLVGFTTLGFKAFTVVQEGTAITVDAPLGPAWAIPPLNLLRDLHRTRFLQVPGGPFESGDVQATREDLTITEHWREGMLVTRFFGRTGDTSDVRVTFNDEDVTIVHDECGYEATIVTTEERRL